MPCQSLIYNCQLKSCLNNIILNAGLSADTLYRWYLKDKFQYFVTGTATTDSEGSLTILLTDYYSAGNFNEYGGDYLLFIDDIDGNSIKLILGEESDVYESVLIHFVPIEGETVDDLFNTIQ